MAHPFFVTVDILLTLAYETVVASMRAKSAAKEMIRISDQAELAMTVGALVQVARLFHDRALQDEKRGHAVFGLTTDTIVFDSVRLPTAVALSRLKVYD